MSPKRERGEEEEEEGEGRRGGKGRERGRWSEGGVRERVEEGGDGGWERWRR